jgi:hypothetical protein
MPGDLPPWPAFYHQTQRWIRAGAFEIIVEDLGSLLREFAGRKPKPTATGSSTAARCNRRRSRAHALDTMGRVRRKGSKVHAAVDTLGHLLALYVTAATE